MPLISIMANPGTALRWKVGDEEAVDGISVERKDTEYDKDKEKRLRRHSSSRTIDPKTAIPIEYRSLYLTPTTA